MNDWPMGKDGFEAGNCLWFLLSPIGHAVVVGMAICVSDHGLELAICVLWFWEIKNNK